MSKALVIIGIAGALLLLKQAQNKPTTLAALNISPKKRRWTGYLPTTARKPFGKPIRINPTAINTGLPAQKVNGKWMKYINGAWIGLTRNESIFMVNGRHVVRRWNWKPS